MVAADLIDEQRLHTLIPAMIAAGFVDGMATPHNGIAMSHGNGWPKGPEAAYLGFLKNKCGTDHGSV